MVIKISNEVLQNMQGSCNYNMKWCEFVGHKTVHVKDCLQTMNFASILTITFLSIWAQMKYTMLELCIRRWTRGGASNHVVSCTNDQFGMKGQHLKHCLLPNVRCKVNSKVLWSWEFSIWNKQNDLIVG